MGAQAQAFYLFFLLLSDLRLSELCNVFRHARFSSIHDNWDHHGGTTDYLCCTGGRGRHSKYRGDSSSSAVVFLKPSNGQRSTCSCHSCGTSGNSRTARDLCARASGELQLAPNRHRDGDTGTSRGSTRTSCGVHPAGAHVSDCTCDDDCDWRRHEQGRHSRRVATASGWLWRSFAVWSVVEERVDDDRDWRGHEQGRHSRRVATASGWLWRSLAEWSPVRRRPHGHQEEEGRVLLKAFKESCSELPSPSSFWISL